jgi:WD40 repeat protein
MCALTILFVITAAANAQDAGPPSPAPQPEAKPVKVEFFWGEGKPVPGLTEDVGIVWTETGDRLYLHKQPILTNKDVVKVDVSKIVFGVGPLAQEHFTIQFHLTKEARKRLAETCGPGGEKMLKPMIDGESKGAPFYLKSRDQDNFVPTTGMYTSKDKVDQIVATFAKAAQEAKESAPQSQTPARPPRKIEIEFRWAEFKQITGVTVEKGIPFGEGDAPLTYMHRRAVLTIADLAEARVEEGFNWEINGKKSRMHPVNLYLTQEGKQKLTKAGMPGTKQLLALLLDGRDTSISYVDVADLSKFSQSVAYREQKEAEELVAEINAAIAAARQGDAAGNANKAGLIFEGHPSPVTAFAFIQDGRRVVSASSNDVRTWDAGTGKQISVVNGLGGHVAAFGMDGQRLAVASRDNVSIFDAADGKKLLSIDPHGDWDRSFPFRPAIGSVAISPDGGLLATGGSTTKVGGPHGLPSGVVAIWDAKSGKQLHRFLVSTFACALAFSGDAKFLAVGTGGAGGELPEPGEVWVWETGSGKAVHTFKTKERVTWDDASSFAAKSVAFSPDGKQIATAVLGMQLAQPAGLIPQGRQPADSVVWDLATDRVAHTLSFEKRWAGTIAFSPDGKWLATAGGNDRMVRVWNAATGKQLKFLPFGSTRANVIAFSPDSRQLFVGGGVDGQSGVINSWSLADEAAAAIKTPISVDNATEIRLIAEVAKEVDRIVRGPGLGELAILQQSKLVEIVDDVHLRPLRKLVEEPLLNGFALSAEGRFAAWQTSGSPVYVVHDLANAKTVEINLGKRTAGFAALSRDGQSIAIGQNFWWDSDDAGKSEIQLFDRSGNLLHTLKSPGPGVTIPVFSPDGRTLAVGNRNFETRLFDVATGKLLHTLPRAKTHEIAFSPDGKVLATGHVDGAIVLWNVGDGTARHTVENAAGEIYTLDWSPQGDLLATAGRAGRIVLWDAQKMMPLEALDSPNWVNSVRFTTDGTRLLASGGSNLGSAERKVTIWAVPNNAGK